tara:strand:+ start:910 stop:2862 length:1953 start_codon:yes stop_codon:yes gene_type:complete
MYQKTTFAIIVALCFLGAQASTAVEEGPTFSTGDTWAFGQEIDLMEEANSEIQELEDMITQEIIESDNFTQIRNWTGLGLDSFELNNEAVLGFFYTGEIVDDFDNMVHMQTEQSLYSHTVIGTKFTSMLPPAGTHDLKIKAYCADEDWNDETEECGEDDDAGQIALLDNNTGEQIVMEQVETVLSGEMHFIAKVTQDTWWTQDTHELVKTQISVALGASGDLTLRNLPNLTYEDENILTLISERENGEGEGEGGVSPCSDWEENEEERESYCYETINVLYETAVVSMDAELSINLLFDFGENPMNAMDLPLDENKYWEGELDRLTISGDIGGNIDISKPELSICPDLDCDQLPEMQELYSEITDALQELHDNETFSITVDRDDDGLPDVITEWNDMFPMYIPETWMDEVFQEIANQVFCNDQESAEEGEECDETAEEEYEKLNLRIENNRFAFGPYNLHDVENFSPIPYAFETGEKESIQSSTGESYEGYRVLPTDSCSDNNPDRNDDECNEEDDDDGDDDDNDGGVIPDGQARSGHDGEDHDDGDASEGLLDGSEIIWFHDADTGHPAYINMNMPNLREEGYAVEMEPISHSVAEEKVEQNADPENPEKTELIEFDSTESLDESSDALPGFGILAAGASLLFVSRRFRK